MKTFPYVWTAGDQQPPLGGVLTKTDLTGSTVRLRLRQPDGTVITIVGSVVAYTAEYSQFQFNWGSTDLVAGDCQVAEVEFENGSGETETVEKFYINVAEALG